jgi:sodium-dependent dicarboxylate transporter 2/3/5
MNAMDSESVPPEFSPVRALLQRIGLFAGPLLALVVAWLLPPEYRNATGDAVAFSAAGRATAALAVWMGVWWMTEAIPVYATALLPLGLLPLLRAGSAKEAAAPYGNELIFLFLGGFLLALSMQRWGLDRRIAFGVLRLLGTRADILVLGFMCVAAFLSMWVSNTAATLTLYPVALSVLVLARGDAGIRGASARNLAHALLLGTAYAASIGGLGTLIGTPPNLFLASFARDSLGIEIGFTRWMLFAVPLVLIFLPIAWWLLVRVFPVRGMRIEGVEELIATALKNMGRMSAGEKATVAAFGCAVIAWVFRPLLATISVSGVKPLAGLTDSGIAILAALFLFIWPSGKGVEGRGRAVMDWEAAKRLPFGLLLLFGGGLSLASAIERNGVGEFLGSQLGGLAGLPVWVFIALATLAVLFLTEMTSNTATAATLIPICAAVAQGMGWEPLLLLVPVALASSCAFMLPVATPPNAIAYGSGEVDGQAMIRAGFWLNLIGAGLILVVMALIGQWVF